MSCPLYTPDDWTERQASGTRRWRAARMARHALTCAACQQERAAAATLFEAAAQLRCTDAPNALRETVWSSVTSTPVAPLPLHARLLPSHRFALVGVGVSATTAVAFSAWLLTAPKPHPAPPATVPPFEEVRAAMLSPASIRWNTTFHVASQDWRKSGAQWLRQDGQVKRFLLPDDVKIGYTGLDEPEPGAAPPNDAKPRVRPILQDIRQHSPFGASPPYGLAASSRQSYTAARVTWRGRPAYRYAFPRDTNTPRFLVWADTETRRVLQSEGRWYDASGKLDGVLTLYDFRYDDQPGAKTARFRDEPGKQDWRRRRTQRAVAEETLPGTPAPFAAVCEAMRRSGPVAWVHFHTHEGTGASQLTTKRWKRGDPPAFRIGPPPPAPVHATPQGAGAHRDGAGAFLVCPEGAGQTTHTANSRVYTAERVTWGGKPADRYTFRGYQGRWEVVLWADPGTHRLLKSEHRAYRRDGRMTQRTIRQEFHYDGQPFTPRPAEADELMGLARALSSSQPVSQLPGTPSAFEAVRNAMRRANVVHWISTHRNAAWKIRFQNEHWTRRDRPALYETYKEALNPSLHLLHSTLVDERGFIVYNPNQSALKYRWRIFPTPPRDPKEQVARRLTAQIDRMPFGHYPLPEEPTKAERVTWEGRSADRYTFEPTEGPKRVDIWANPATHRLLRCETVYRDGEDKLDDTLINSDFRYDETPPSGVFDLTPPTEAYAANDKARRWEQQQAERRRKAQQRQRR